MLFYFLAFIVFCGCESDGDSADNNSSQKQPDEPSLTLSDIKGVWVDMGNPLYYVAIYSNGRYTFCLNDMLIGSGKCVLEKGTLTFHNEYTYVSDKVAVALLGDRLVVKGQVTDHKQVVHSINKQFQLNSNEQLSPSLAGYSNYWTGGLNVYYDNTRVDLTFTSDYIFVYEHTGRSKKTGQYSTIRYYMWYYVYRKPYTYGFKINEDCPRVEIYDFPFVYDPNAGCIDFRLADYRIQ